MLQQLFVHVKPPPRQSGQTDIENDAPLRMPTHSISTGQQMVSSVAETWSTSISPLDCPMQTIGMRLV
ncbi:MAG: hypothetical protein IJG13_01625, partial [Kiritimatiellae bacterium]|nr:hypothetical protein [Kiritimatiellia bacterium]